MKCTVQVDCKAVYAKEIKERNRSRERLGECVSKKRRGRSPSQKRTKKIKNEKTKKRNVSLGVHHQQRLCIKAGKYDRVGFTNRRRTPRLSQLPFFCFLFLGEKGVGRVIDARITARQRSCSKALVGRCFRRLGGRPRCATET